MLLSSTDVYFEDQMTLLLSYTWCGQVISIYMWITRVLLRQCQSTVYSWHA